MHVDFNSPQKMLDPAAIKKQQDDKAAADKVPVDAAPAAKAQQDRASPENATALDIGAAGKAQAAQRTGGTWGSFPLTSTPPAPSSTNREFTVVRILVKKDSALLTYSQNLMSAAAGTTMSMFMGSTMAK